MTPQIKERIAQIKKGEIPQGYKATEVGIVPCEWETITLGELFDFFGGLGIPRDKLGNNGIPYLHYGDMHRHSFTKASYEQFMLLPKYDTKLNGDEKFLLRDGDVVFLDASEDLEGTSRSAVIDNVENKPFISGLHTFIARPKRTILSKGYKQYFTVSQEVKRQFEKKSVGFKVYGVNRNSIRGISITYPTSEAEQNRIAEILLSQDKVIALKEKLIAQKQEQKKYLMQVLLTGKQRLKGFSGEWESKKLGDITNITTGKLDANAMEENGKYFFFTCAKEVFRINTYAFDTEAILISGNGANVGYVHHYKGKFNAYQRTYILTEMKENVLFLKFILNNDLSSRIDREKCSGNTPYIILSTLSQMKITFPPLPEQEAIAKILTTADKEIELLQKQLEQEKQRKKSLMQLLLTGIVRV